jgi:hypothetical protein
MYELRTWRGVWILDECRRTVNGRRLAASVGAGIGSETLAPPFALACSG